RVEVGPGTDGSRPEASAPAISPRVATEPGSRSRKECSGGVVLSSRPALQRVVAAFARADTHDVAKVVGPDLPVADPAGARRRGDDVHDLVDIGRLHEYLDPDLGNEVGGVLGSPVGLGLAALATVALDLDHREPERARAPERLFHLFEHERLDDGGHKAGHRQLLLAAGSPPDDSSMKPRPR